MRGRFDSRFDSNAKNDSQVPNTVFPLVLTWLTLNGVIALILLYFTKFDSFAGQLCHSG